MQSAYKSIFKTVVSILFLTGCSGKIKQIEDKVYSRHLQEYVNLTVLSTQMPDDKKTMNLLILNDGQDIEKFRVKKILDSLADKDLIQPLMIVAVKATDRMQQYGVSGIPDYLKRGSKADKYSSFMDDELLPFIKKKAGVRKFRSVAIAGCSLGGLSAFDIAWDHSDKIDKVGVFSGSFWWRDKDITAKDYSDENNRILLSKIKSSRKKPKLSYWFYTGAKEEETDRDKDSIIDVIDDTKDLINILQSKNICLPSDIIYTESPDGKHDYPYWSKAFPVFLQWAFGK